MYSSTAQVDRGGSEESNSLDGITLWPDHRQQAVVFALQFTFTLSLSEPVQLSKY